MATKFNPLNSLEDYSQHIRKGYFVDSVKNATITTAEGSTTFVTVVTMKLNSKTALGTAFSFCFPCCFNQIQSFDGKEESSPSSTIFRNLSVCELTFDNNVVRNYTHLRQIMSTETTSLVD